MVTERDNVDGIELSLETLDDLVREALQARPASAQALLAARQNLEAGDVDSAMAVQRDVCPQLMQAGGRYHFKLVKQKFVEACAHGADYTAIACARNELAPLALDAYLEAYEEFKTCLRLLVYTKDVQRQQQDSLKELCGQATRRDLAAAVYHAGMQSLGLQEPTLVRLLAYLLRLYQSNRSETSQQQQQEEQEAADQLLLPGKDAAPFPCEGGISSFREADIQALIQCAGCSRREAMDALRRSEGDLQAAFSAELARLRLDRALLGRLVEEYAVFRGMRAEEARCKGGVPWVSTAAGTEDEGGEPMDTSCSGRAGGQQPHLDMNVAVATHDGEDRAGSGGASCNTDAVAGAACAGVADGCAGAGVGAQGQAPWSVRQHLNLLYPQRSISQSPPNKVPRCEGATSTPNHLRQAGGAGASGGAPGGTSSHHGLCDSRRRELPQLVHDLAKEGQVPRVIQAVTELDAAFFDGHPQLLFDLRRCEFLQLLDAGETGQALMHARTQLSPLAARHSALQPALKATTAMLLGVGHRGSVAAALQQTAASLQAALRAHMGVRGPLLIRLLQLLLRTHRAWLRREKFNDPFQNTLRLEALRSAATVAGHAAGGPAPSPGLQRSRSELQLLADLQGNFEEDEEAEDEGPAPIDEDRILRVMEILEIPRSTAMDLLIHHDGDVEAAIMSSLG